MSELRTSLATLDRLLESAPSRAVTASTAEATWNQSSDLGVLLRLLTETKNPKKRELKITPKVRKALSAMMTETLDTVMDWYVDLDGTPVPVSVGLTDWLGGVGQAEAFRMVRAALKSRSSWVSKFSNPKTYQKGTTRTADYFLTAAIILASMARGSTSNRVDFLLEVLGAEAHKAGGSQLTMKMVKALKQHVKWADVAKLRKSRKVKTAEVHSSPASLQRTNEDARVIDAYVSHELMEHSPIDLVLTQLLSRGPARMWDGPDYVRPDHRVAILTAVPRDKDCSACFEKSKQGLELVRGLEQEIDRRVDLALYACRGADLPALYKQAIDNGIGSVHRLLQQTNVSSWYNQVTDSRGNMVADLKPVHGLAAKLMGYLVLNSETTEERGQHMRGLVRYVRAHKLVPDHVIAHVMRTAMPWDAVRRMLAYRTELA
jgi:hypothetical protein